MVDFGINVSKMKRLFSTFLTISIFVSVLVVLTSTISIDAGMFTKKSVETKFKKSMVKFGAISGVVLHKLSPVAKKVSDLAFTTAKVSVIGSAATLSVILPIFLVCRFLFKPMVKDAVDGGITRFNDTVSHNLRELTDKYKEVANDFNAKLDSQRNGIVNNVKDLRKEVDSCVKENTNQINVAIKEARIQVDTLVEGAEKRANGVVNNIYDKFPHPLDTMGSLANKFAKTINNLRGFGNEPETKNNLKNNSGVPRAMGIDLEFDKFKEDMNKVN